MTRGEVRANVKAGRWARIGRHVLAVVPGRLDLDTRLWAAQLSGGPRAQLDGEAALLAAGLTGYSVKRLRVSVPRGARTFRDHLVDVRQTRRWDAADSAATGVPRTPPAVAAVRAALWARSDEQAALLLAMTVQQRLASAEDLELALGRVRRAPRLGYVHEVVADLGAGAESIGEIDFARECRRRGLPEPDRQVARRLPGGRAYVDVEWREYGVVVEVDGIHHAFVDQVVPDALRHNEVTLANALVLRLPVLGLRTDPDGFFDQIARALVARGWSGEVAA